MVWTLDNASLYKGRCLIQRRIRQKDCEVFDPTCGSKAFLFGVLVFPDSAVLLPDIGVLDYSICKKEKDMSSTEKPTTRPTLGLAGLTSNAMALIAPGAFLWLTFFIQSSYGAPMAAQGMWFGIFFALILCLATAIAYAELSKLYPGAGSSYFFAEQAFLSKTHAYKFARIAKFMVGWASHLYYWVYTGLMVCVTALVVGYLIGQIWPDSINAAFPAPLFTVVFCPLFASWA